MSRRRRGGLIDGAGGEVGDEIEILDLDAPRSQVDAQIVEIDPSDSNSRVAILGALVVGGLAMLGVVTAGNTPAPEPPAPSVTVPPDPATVEETDRATEIAELEATYGVEIGDGPGLVWDLVVWNISTNEFRWIDDGFVGQDGSTEWTIRPGVLGPSIGQRQSPELEYPGYAMRLVDGARVLVPEGAAPDHVIALVGDRDPVRVELPPGRVVPSTELITIQRTWFDGVAVDEQLVIAGFESVNVDIPALATRTGRDLSDVVYVEVSTDRLRLADGNGNSNESLQPILFADVQFTEEELADLRLSNSSWGSELLTIDLVTNTISVVALDDPQWIDTIGRTSNGIALSWGDQSGQGWLSTSADGLTWSTAPLDLGSQVSFSGTTMYAFPFSARTMRRSSDFGRTWQRTRTPFISSFNSLAIDDILVIIDDPGSRATNDETLIEIDADDYDLTITGAGRTFELTDPLTGDIVLSGSIDDSASGAAFDPFGVGLAISDPESGEELLSIPQGTLLQAYAQAQEWPTPEVAISRWDPSADDPEWNIQPIDVLFSDAVRVQFIPGDGYLLAIATTERGYDYYVARTTREP